jgi:adenine-specific DNA-methyltransferase
VKMQAVDSKEALETRRLQLQAQLDAASTAEERNKLGQFATPPTLADDILAYGRSLLPADTCVRFLDPAFGTGSFYSALCRTLPLDRISSARAYEIDERYGIPTTRLWEGSQLQLILTDFTRATPPARDEDKANLIICNPPYVRHHHLSGDEKARLQAKARQVAGTTVNKLAGLYCYFLLLSHAWLAPGGLAGWLIPSEFMDVNYGRSMKHYLMHRVTLLRIHRFEPTDMQFADALVSSAVVWFKNDVPPPRHTVEFTYGGTHQRPHLAKSLPLHALDYTPKWTALPAAQLQEAAGKKEIALGDLFTIRRGLATGDNRFFILTSEQIKQYELPHDCLIPILPSPRHLQSDIVEADTDGGPALSRRLFLLSCSLPQADVRTRYPSLWRYLQKGVEAGVNVSYLCRHRRPWYLQERRPPAPLLCTYMGRRDGRNSSPFRFILNYSRATAANTYHMLYPKPRLAVALANDPTRLTALWQALNEIAPETVMGEGRVYGGGLHKLEPKELANIPASSVVMLLSQLDADSDSSSIRQGVETIGQMALM